MRAYKSIFAWLFAIILFIGIHLAPSGLKAQETTPEESDMGWIAHTLQDEFLNDYAIAITAVDGTRVMEIALDSEAPENYTTRCDAAPKWSPEGTRLAFVRQLKPDIAEQQGMETDVRELVIYHVESGESRVVTDRLFRTFDWSPDGEQIVHDTDIDYSDDNQTAESSGLFLLNVESGESQQLIAPIDGNPLWRPAWSPDGGHIGFYQAQAIEGLGAFTLAEADGTDVVTWDAATVGAFDWSPDGTHIVFDNVLYLPEDSQLSTAGIDRSNQAQNVEVIVDEMTPNQPQWSPDGALIGFLNEEGEIQSSLWVAEPNGQGQRQIAPANVVSFDWSPDSTRLVANTDAGIQVLALSGDGAQTIAEGGCPTWRPEPAM